MIKHSNEFTKTKTLTLTSSSHQNVRRWWTKKTREFAAIVVLFFMSSAKIISSCEHESQILTHSIDSWLWHVSLNKVISLILWTYNFISPFNCLFHNAPYPVLNPTLCKICTQKIVRVIFNLKELYRLFGLYSFQ